MPAKKTTATAAALADAFASLSVEGKPVTVRTLRERAGVSTDAAAEWLRTNRSARDVSPPPADVLTRVLEPLWSAAVAVARDEQAEATAAEREGLVHAEAEALAELAAETERADAAEAEIAQLRREVADFQVRLDTAESARAEQAAAAAAALKDAACARDAQHSAALAAAEAQATARTLREVIDTQRWGAQGDSKGTD